MEKFSIFDPLVTKIMSRGRDFKSHPLAEVPRLPRWVSRSGKVVLIGDAAHGMLQFVAQGAAMATEDAGTLAECIGCVRSKEDLPRDLLAFERSRKWRCEKVRAAARRNGEVIHLADGEEQEHRDRKTRGLRREDDGEVDAGPFLDGTFTQWLYSHEVFEHVSLIRASHSWTRADSSLIEFTDTQSAW